MTDQHNIAGLRCAVCQRTDNLMQCGGCKSEVYCSRDHQKEHWPAHRRMCRKNKRRRRVRDPLLPQLTVEQYALLRNQAAFLKGLSPSSMPPFPLLPQERFIMALLIEEQFHHYFDPPVHLREIAPEINFPPSLDSLPIDQLPPSFLSFGPTLPSSSPSLQDPILIPHASSSTLEEDHHQTVSFGEFDIELQSLASELEGLVQPDEDTSMEKGPLEELFKLAPLGAFVDPYSLV